MERRLIGRGLLAGLVAGVLAFVFAKIFAEPQIGAAIDYEAGRDAAQQALDRAAGLPVPAEGSDPFSRGVQSGIGIATGLIVLSVALGGMYAVVFSLVYRQLLRSGGLGVLRTRGLAMLVALAAFVLVFAVPALKYPPNPPAIGHEETIGPRTGLYLTTVAASILFGVVALWLARRLRSRFSAWTAALLAGAGFVVVMAVLMALLPSLGELQANVAAYGRHATETPLPLTDPAGAIVYPGFDADVLYRFRLYALLNQALIWGVIGLVFGVLAARLLEPRTTSSASARPADPAQAARGARADR
jgi:hypothetical protein